MNRFTGARAVLAALFSSVSQKFVLSLELKGLSFPETPKIQRGCSSVTRSVASQVTNLSDPFAKTYVQR